MLAFHFLYLLFRDLRLIHVLLLLSVPFFDCFFQFVFASLLTLLSLLCLSVCVLSGVPFGCDKSKIIFFEWWCLIFMHACFSYITVCWHNRGLIFPGWYSSVTLIFFFIMRFFVAFGFTKFVAFWLILHFNLWVFLYVLHDCFCGGWICFFFLFV